MWSKAARRPLRLRGLAADLRRASPMASVPGKDRLLSVSIMAGPARDAAIEMLTGGGVSDRVSMFHDAPGAQPEELVRRLNAIAEQGETSHLVVPCEEERPAMA